MNERLKEHYLNNPNEKLLDMKTFILCTIMPLVLHFLWCYKTIANWGNNFVWHASLIVISLLSIVAVIVATIMLKIVQKTIKNWLSFAIMEQFLLMACNIYFWRLKPTALVIVYVLLPLPLSIFSLYRIEKRIKATERPKKISPSQITAIAIPCGLFSAIAGKFLNDFLLKNEHFVPFLIVLLIILVAYGMFLLLLVLARRLWFISTYRSTNN